MGATSVPRKVLSLSPGRGPTRFRRTDPYSLTTR